MKADQSELTRTLAAIGISLAVVISWTENESILWGIVHGFLNWFYIVYWGVF